MQLSGKMCSWSPPEHPEPWATPGSQILPTSCLRFLQKPDGLQLNFLERLQLIPHWLSAFAANLGMEMQREPVRPSGVDQFGLERQLGLYGF